jgi:protein-disulfide isomerase
MDVQMDKHLRRLNTPNWILFFTWVIFSIQPTSTSAMNSARNEPALGSKQAPVTLIEYGSLTCDHCVRFHRKVFPIILKNYINEGLVRFIFRDFPTSDTALRGATAARCAGKNYYNMLDKLFKSTAIWTQSNDLDEALTHEAQTMRMETAPFLSCLKNPENMQNIIDRREEAKTQHNITGTPTFVINEKIVRGIRNVREMSQLLDQAILQTQDESVPENPDMQTQ